MSIHINININQDLVDQFRDYLNTALKYETDLNNDEKLILSLLADVSDRLLSNILNEIVYLIATDPKKETPLDRTKYTIPVTFIIVEGIRLRGNIGHEIDNHLKNLIETGTYYCHMYRIVDLVLKFFDHLDLSPLTTTRYSSTIDYERDERRA